MPSQIEKALLQKRDHPELDVRLIHAFFVISLATMAVINGFV